MRFIFSISHLLKCLLAAFILFLYSCRNEENLPILLTQTDTLKPHPVNILVRKKNQSSESDYNLNLSIAYDQQRRISRITELYRNNENKITDTSQCSYAYNEGRLTSAVWIGKTDQGIYGSNVKTTISSEINYDNAGKILQIKTINQSTIATKTTTVSYIPELSGTNTLTYEVQNGVLKKLIRYIHDTINEEIFVKTNNFTDLIYKKNETELLVKNLNGSWQTKAYYGSIKNQLHFCFWKLIEVYISEKGQISSQRHFSTINPDPVFFIDQYIKDSFTFFPLVYDNTKFDYITDANKNLVSISGGTVESEIIFTYRK